MGEELRRIRRVRPGDEPKSLVVEWKGGGRDIVNLTGLIACVKAFAPLAEPELFRQVDVVAYGLGIGWPNGLDYSGTNLRLIADEQRPMAVEEFIGWQRDSQLSNQEAADVLARSITTVKNYRTGKSTIPMTVAATVRAMWREPTVFFAHYIPRRPGRPRKTA